MILKKIKKSKEMKVKYLELLASKGRKKKFIYEELLKEYLKGTGFILNLLKSYISNAIMLQNLVKILLKYILINSVKRCGLGRVTKVA